MAETPARSSLQGPATAGTVETIHTRLDRLWARAPYVPDPDRAAFTLAVVEAATNTVRHAVPATRAPIRLKVNLTADPLRLEAEIYEIGAAPVDIDLDAAMPGELLESGRGLAMIQSLVSSVCFERAGDANVWLLCRDCRGAQP